MEKKFANLGTMLSRAQAKKIVGGAEEEVDPYTTCFECTAGAKEWGFGCPSPLRSDCSGSAKLDRQTFPRFHLVGDG